ncbi:MAG: LysM peptidoglycan-binding domain-containing protein [Clostridia bacterium]|nr:LysM peptidoglycan-binding domain-containing protein [Clostridia bacterium]
MKAGVLTQNAAFTPLSAHTRFGGLRRRLVIWRLRLRRAFTVTGNCRTARGVRRLLAFITIALLALLRGIFRLCLTLVVFVADRTAVFREPLAELYAAWKAALLKARAALPEHVRVFTHSRSRLVPCAMLVCATITIFSASYFGVALEVSLDGQPLGFIGQKSEMEQIITEVEQRAAEYTGKPYHLNLDLKYSLSYVQRDNMLDTEAVRELLFSKISEISTQYVLKVNGEIIGAQGSKTALELLKQRILKARAANAPEGAKVEFLQDVVIEEQPVANAEIRSIDEMEAVLNSNSKEVISYTVKSGDTVSAIAQQYSLSMTEVQKLNPHLNLHRIAVGDQVRVSAAVPMLSTKTTVKESYTEKIPFETVVQKTDKLYTNQSRVVKAGVSGKAAVTANVVYVDGEEQSRSVLSYEVVNEPVNEVKEQGTKALPKKAPKGSFIHPFRGIVSSRYGYRSRGFHTGIDFAGPTGSSIVAADGGTVTLARWNGGYGYCVIIDHGNGYQTLYAHASKLLVKQGQKVAQGEVIARVGSTGNSTGPHLHFEVRINGKTVNPAKYIGKSY